MNLFRSFRGLFAPILLLVALSGFAPQSAGYPGFVGVRPAILGGGPAILSYLVVGGGTNACGVPDAGSGGNVAFGNNVASPAVGSYPVVVGLAGGAGSNHTVAGRSSWNGIQANGGNNDLCATSGGTNSGVYSISGSSLTYGVAGNDDNSGAAARANSGNGGSTDAGAGGAGTVIIRYVTGSQTWTGCTITTVGPDTVHTCTAGATLQRTA